MVEKEMVEKEMVEKEMAEKEMAEKFVLKITQNPDSFQPLGLNRDTYDKIMEVKAKTGLKAYQIVDSMVDYCLERLEIQE